MMDIGRAFLIGFFFFTLGMLVTGQIIIAQRTNELIAQTNKLIDLQRAEYVERLGQK